MAKDESSESPSDSEYSSEEESRRRRRREKKKRKHSRKKRYDSGSEDEKDDGKKKKRKRRSHSSEDEESDEKRSSRRHEKRKKRRHHSSEDESENESKSRRKKKELLKQAKKLIKESEKRLAESTDATAPDSSKKKAEKLSEDDYYVKSNEFATWLKENHGLYFSSLSAEETRKLFVKFVDVWNSGSLPQKFYEGISKGPRSSHKWNLQHDQQVDEENIRMEKRKKDKSEQKKYQKEHELVMDELLPQATGKDRLLEKKAIQREKNRNRDLSPEPMRESDIMGGGDDFKAMLARERARREKKSSQKFDAYQKKLSAAEEKESAAMDQFRALVNTAGGKISIPKRT